MGKFLQTFLILLCFLTTVSSQCPDLASNTSVNGSTNTDIDFCGAESATFNVSDTNLPTGTIDWYSSTTSGFDPLVGGTPIGSSNIDSADPCDPGGCPTIEVIYIDACGPVESLNEFMVIGSGSGFAIDDLSVTFDDNNTFGSAANESINIGGTCGWFMGDLSLFSGCGSLIAVGPGDFIPPNSAVIVQTSRLGSTVYDVSGLCGVSECIYVVSNSCDRSVGAFSNCGAGTGSGSTRNNEIALTCGCNDVLVYDILDPNFVSVCMNDGGDGMHVFSDLTYVNNGCNQGPNLATIPQYSYAANTTPFNHSFTDAECNTTQYVVGVLNSDQYNEDCCSEQVTDEYAFNISCASAQLMGDGVLCPNECVEIAVEFMGGTAPYELNLLLSGIGIPISIILPGFPVGEKITICFDTGGPIVDQATFTVNVPGLAAGFNGSLNLNSFTDVNGCAGTILGSSVSVSFNAAPSATSPAPQEACDMGDGTAFFILSDIDNQINGGSGATVNYFSDPDGLIAISNPHQSGTTTIYAQVEGAPCDSEIVPVDLVVISNGDAGLVTIFCTGDSGPSSDCNICDDDGTTGENVDLTLIFDDPTLNYDFEVVWISESGPSSTIIGSGIGTAVISHTIFDQTTFQVTVVTPDGDCADYTDLGDIITINYGLLPQMEDPGDISNCGPVTLPDIVGNEVPDNAGYYTMPGGMGTMYTGGDIISTSQTLYLYGGFQDCELEIEIDISIDGLAIVDGPAPVTQCGSYALPPITGTNVENANYYTEVDGGGDIVAVGTLISSSIDLYLLDPNCPGNQALLEITITPGPSIENLTDTIVCDTFFLPQIIGSDLSGNEGYFELMNASGQALSVGDTITVDSTFYIYDNTAGCELEIPFHVDIKGFANPGLDTIITYCVSELTNSININEELGGSLPDEGGEWIELNTTDLITDSTAVDFLSLSEGTYNFEYQIMDSICVDTTAMLTINIVAELNAGEDASLSICSDTSGVNIYTILGNPDEGGILLDETGSEIVIDISNAGFLADAPGSVDYLYIVGDANSSCGADTSIFTLIQNEPINAGMDMTQTVCSGLVVPLPLQLQGHTSLGNFVDPLSSGGLVGSQFNSALVADGTYEIYHILDGIGSCPNDTAIITLIVIDGPSAGDEQSINVCGEESINLDDYIDGDSGGAYYLNDIELPSSIITFTNEFGSIDYLYIVGDGAACPFDTAIITVDRSVAPYYTSALSTSVICDEECITYTFSVENIGGQTHMVYYHIEGDNGTLHNRVEIVTDFQPPTMVELCGGEGLLSDDIVEAGITYSIVLDSIITENDDCVYIIDDIVTFEVLDDSEGDFSGNYCYNQNIIVGDDTYNINNQTGTSVLENGASNGCDSIVIVDLLFEPLAEGNYQSSHCSGQVVTVLGIDYTENYTGDTLLANASHTGCDSLVNIDIEFTTNVSSDYMETICDGAIVIVGGVEFSSATMMEEVVIPGGSAGGCDSSIFVTIFEEESAIMLIDYQVCSTYSIVVNNQVYNIDNPMGTDTVSGVAINGCDSIYNIDLDFSLEGIDSTFAFSTCDESYSLQVGSMTFDSSTPTGSVVLPASPGECDTTLTVDLTFGAVNVIYTEVDGNCEVVDSGSVIIEEVNGVAPYNIIFNGNNAIAFVLPIEIQLPIGAGTIMLTDADGCATDLPYELFEGETGEDFSISQIGNQLNIQGGTADSVVWTPSEGLSCTTCIDPIVTVDQTTSFTAQVYFGGLCELELIYIFEVEDNIPDYILPSVFSPNGDGQNDNFTLFITDGAIGTPVSMQIFDRWGNRMYIENDGTKLTTDGWDGSYSGSDVAPGVYVYHVVILEGEKVINLYGDLTVIR